MTSYTSSFNLLCVLLAVAIILLVEAAARTYLVTPFDQTITLDINEKKPDLIFLSSSWLASMQNKSIFQDEMNNLTGRNVSIYYTLPTGGVEFSYFFLVLKNRALPSHVGRTTIVVPGIQNYYTTIGTGKINNNAQVYDSVLTDYEPVFFGKVRGSKLLYLDDFLSFYKTYRYRYNLGPKILEIWLNQVLKLANFQINAKGLIEKRFIYDNLLDPSDDPPSESYLSRTYDFGSNLNDSFLPDIVGLGGDLNLVFLDMPSNPEYDYGKTYLRKGYRGDLAEYLRGNNITFILLSDEPEYENKSLYRDQWHMKKANERLSRDLAKKLHAQGAVS
jgi:hypothetical protein